MATNHQPVLFGTPTASQGFHDLQPWQILCIWLVFSPWFHTSGLSSQRCESNILKPPAPNHHWLLVLYIYIILYIYTYNYTYMIIYRSFIYIYMLEGPVASLSVGHNPSWNLYKTSWKLYAYILEPILWILETIYWEICPVTVPAIKQRRLYCRQLPCPKDCIPFT